MKLTPEQLKGKVRSFSIRNGLRAQDVLQMVMFEQLLSRIELSKYKENFVIKGGVLIASMIGISSRTTMDLDTTLKGIEMSRENIERIIKEIITIKTYDKIEFEYDSIVTIRGDGHYANFRVNLYANFGKIHLPMKIDITTGDSIFPGPIDFSYQKLFSDQFINIRAYPVETILAEKYETILRRNIANTRARDFYDVYILFKTKRDSISICTLKENIMKTSIKRGSLDYINDWRSTINDIRNEETLELMWSNYMNNNKYASSISFTEVIDNIESIALLLEL